MVGERARAGGIKLLVMAAPPAVTLQADPRATKQVLLNLLTNAIKYTCAGGSILVSWADTTSSLAISVADTGVGISEQALQKIFEPFQRGDSMIANKTEGTGLGLAISRKLMELQGGALTLTSRPGVGTVATMVLPAGRIVRPAAAHRPDPQPNAPLSAAVGRIAGQSAE